MAVCVIWTPMLRCGPAPHVREDAAPLRSRTGGGSPGGYHDWSEWLHARVLTAGTCSARIAARLLRAVHHHVLVQLREWWRCLQQGGAPSPQLGFPRVMIVALFRAFHPRHQ